MEQIDQSPKMDSSPHHSFLTRDNRVLTLVLILLAAFLLALTIKTSKEIGYVGGGISPTNAISVSGNGEVVVVPDTAEFTFSLTEEGETATIVRDAVTKKAGEVMQALKEKGVDETKDVKTVAYNLSPKYEWQPVACVKYPCDRKQVQKGFTLEQSVRVKVRDIDRAGEVIEAVTSKGVKSVGGIAFTTDDEDKGKNEARKVAIDEARAKAEMLAADLGVSLVRIIGFSEDGSYPMPYYAKEVSMSMDSAGMVAQAPALPAGENTVVSNVSITYEIR